MAANTDMGKPSLVTDHQNLSFRATGRGLRYTLKYVGTPSSSAVKVGLYSMMSAQFCAKG